VERFFFGKIVHWLKWLDFLLFDVRMRSSKDAGTRKRVCTVQRFLRNIFNNVRFLESQSFSFGVSIIIGSDLNRLSRSIKRKACVPI